MHWACPRADCQQSQMNGGWEETVSLPVEGLTTDGVQGTGSQDLRMSTHWRAHQSSLDSFVPMVTQMVKLLNSAGHKQNKTALMWENDLQEGGGTDRSERDHRGGGGRVMRMGYTLV